MDNKELDKSRAEFEAWMRSKCDTEEYATLILQINTSGIYPTVSVQSAWEGWKAALARAGSEAPTGQQAEPVAWMCLSAVEPEFTSDALLAGYWMRKGRTVTPLYAAMSAAQAQPKDTTDTNAYRAKECWPRADAANVKDTKKGQA